MNPKKRYRNNGTIGALLDEYEKALIELIEVVNGTTHKQLTEMVDHTTEDKDCQSIQSILTHVVASGYNYVVEVRRWLGEHIDYKDRVELTNAGDYRVVLIEMFRFSEQLFEDHPNIKLVELDFDKKIKLRWGQVCDIEQLFQHAIVHVLKHRRQIKRFKEHLKKHKS